MTGVTHDTRGPCYVGRRSCALVCGRVLLVALLVFQGLATGFQIVGGSVVWAQGNGIGSTNRSGGADDRLRQPPSQDEVLVDVRIEGNTTIKTEAIAKHIKSRPGRPLNTRQVRADVDALYRTWWFNGVNTSIRRTEQGLVLTFLLIEKPIVQRVDYRGNDKIKTKHLAAQTGLKKGSPFDISKNREAAKRLESYYHDRGYAHATVELELGNSMRDREVVFRIFEGPKTRVTKIKFKGNKSFSSALLNTKLRTKKAFFGLFGGKYDPTTRNDDIAALRQYYHNLGYFDVKIIDQVGFSKDRSRAQIAYLIDEGKRFKVGEVELVGNRVYSKADLTQELNLKPGEYFNQRFLNKDLNSINEKYYERGRLFAKVEAVPRFLEEPGVADLVYHIDEDKPYRFRMINVHILGDDPHTQRSVVLNVVNQAGLRPGDLANKKIIELAKSRLGGSQLFLRDPVNGPRIDIKPLVSGLAEADRNVLRGQSDRAESQPTGAWNRRTAHGAQVAPPAARQSRDNFEPAGESPVSVRPKNHSEAKKSSPKVFVPIVPPGELIPTAFHVKSRRQVRPPGGSVIRGQNYDNGIRRPGNPMFGGGPQGDPFGGADDFQADVDIYVSEERTGRLMFGVGVNSDSGVVGSIILSENNFNIARFPTSWNDLVYGNAWRGRGQRFRLEAVPGNVVSRYTASWTDPYFMNSDYSLNLSGFFYERFFPDWDEERTGGRVQVGRQLTPEWSVSGAFRLESIDLSNPDTPTPLKLMQAVGSNFFSSFRAAITHDTRDSAFLPGAGHMVELAFEQAFGDFSYPRGELEARQYYTVFSRPDGGGRHIVSVGGNLGWTGDDTPIFENYFAGGFQSFRGFDYRGVGPRVFDVRVGGQWLALGSVEYMAPLMANESIQGVAFTDFGTVEADVGLDDFRVTVGLGLRVTIPAMGPVPLAFDFAVPLIDVSGDETRVFSFYVGVIR